MIITQLLTLLAYFINAIASALPVVSSLPSINGYDLDSAMVVGVGQAYNFANYVWPVRDVLIGAAIIWGVHLILVFLRLIIGHRAPVAH